MSAWLRTIIPGLLAVTLLWPAGAAAETIRFSQDAQVASATFRSTDDTGCVLTEVYVAAQDERRHDGAGPGVESSSALLAISRYQLCTGEILLAATGSSALAPEAFSIDGLDTAWLEASIPVVDELTGASFVVDAALSWSAYGDALRIRDTTQVWTEAFTINFRFDGTDRFASATGVITDGSTSFAPEPAVEGFLKELKAGKLDVIRNG